jgi:hypothetical protein
VDETEAIGSSVLHGIVDLEKDTSKASLLELNPLPGGNIIRKVAPDAFSTSGG